MERELTHDDAIEEYKWAASVAAEIVTQFAYCEIPKICNELGERYDLAYEHCFMRLAAAVTQEVADILIENGKV